MRQEVLGKSAMYISSTSPFPFDSLPYGSCLVKLLHGTFPLSYMKTPFAIA